MIFVYKAIDIQGEKKAGEIDAVNYDVALSSLQKRGLVVITINAKNKKNLLEASIPFFDNVPMKDVVIMSRQISTLFEAQVSPVNGFSLLAQTMKNNTLRDTLNTLVSDIQGGLQISDSMAKHPRVFSNFYVNMVRSGEESGKLSQTFKFLADYLERNYELVSKTRNALIYPAFVVVTFIIVIILMMTLVIPKLSKILIDTGQELPIYTKIVIGISNFFVEYGLFVLIALVFLGIYIAKMSGTKKGQQRIDQTKLDIPYLGTLYRKLYLARIADNMNTMLSSGIPVIRTLEITAEVIDNSIFRNIIYETIEDIKAGTNMADAFRKHDEFPPIMIQMVQVGEETGKTSEILETMSRFYKREVDQSVDTLIGLIEPAMIIGLAVGVGFLLVSILMPIYNIATNF